MNYREKGPTNYCTNDANCEPYHTNKFSICALLHTLLHTFAYLLTLGHGMSSCQFSRTTPHYTTINAHNVNGLVICVLFTNRYYWNWQLARKGNIMFERFITRRMERCVKRGLERLDDELPGWQKKINREELNIGSNSQCMLGQLFGDYPFGEAKLFPGLFGVAKAMYHGFHSGVWPFVTPSSLNRRYTALWLEKIQPA